MTQPNSILIPILASSDSKNSASSLWWAVNKPAGMSVHNDPKNDLLSVFQKQLGLTTALHAVHRLDKETSVVILLAKDASTAHQLTQALQQPTAQKIYRALLRGAPKTASTSWVWNQPLTDKAEGRLNPQGKSQDRQACTTQVTKLRSTAYITEIQAELITGRQHQIRKHAALNQQAILGDTRYNDVKYNSMIQERYKVTRMMLHAELLRFPWNQQELEIQAPVPTEFDQILQTV
jgi:23S rRNA-/tRNA-specific pseudouridylate synthase